MKLSASSTLLAACIALFQQTAPPADQKSLQPQPEELIFDARTCDIEGAVEVEQSGNLWFHKCGTLALLLLDAILLFPLFYAACQRYFHREAPAAQLTSSSSGGLVDPAAGACGGVVSLSSPSSSTAQGKGCKGPPPPKQQGKGQKGCKGPAPPASPGKTASPVRPQGKGSKGPPPPAPSKGGKGPPPPCQGGSAAAAKGGAKGKAPPPPKASTTGEGKGKDKSKVKGNWEASAEQDSMSGGKPPFERRLRWRPLAEEVAKSTVFKDLRIHSQVKPVDVQMLHAVFERTATASASSATSRAAACTSKPQGLCLLGAKRAHNLGIVMRGFPVAMTDLCHSLLRCDFSLKLSEEDIAALLDVWPTVQEQQLVKQDAIKRADGEDLRDVEKFVVQVASVPRSAERLRFLQLSMSLEGLQDAVKDACEKMLSAVAELRASQRWRKVLLSALGLGNYINHGIFEGAHGFAFEDLLQLQHMKGAGSVSGLHCLAVACGRQEPHFCKELLVELPSLPEAGRISLVTLQQQLTRLEANLREMSKELAEHQEAYQLKIPEEVTQLPQHPSLPKCEQEPKAEHVANCCSEPERSLSLPGKDESQPTTTEFQLTPRKPVEAAKGQRSQRSQRSHWRTVTSDCWLLLPPEPDPSSPLPIPRPHLQEGFCLPPLDLSEDGLAANTKLRSPGEAFKLLSPVQETTREPSPSSDIDCSSADTSPVTSPTGVELEPMCLVQRALAAEFSMAEELAVTEADEFRQAVDQRSRLPFASREVVEVEMEVFLVPSLMTKQTSRNASTEELEKQEVKAVCKNGSAGVLVPKRRAVIRNSSTAILDCCCKNPIVPAKKAQVCSSEQLLRLVTRCHVFLNTAREDLGEAISETRSCQRYFAGAGDGDSTSATPERFLGKAAELLSDFRIASEQISKNQFRWAQYLDPGKAAPQGGMRRRASVP